MDCIIWEHIMVGDKMGLKTFYDRPLYLDDN